MSETTAGAHTNTECAGFLLFNDPHIGSRRPDRRKDDYTATTLAKLEFIIAHANAHRLVPLCTGDLFDVAREEDDSIKTRIQRILSGCWTTAGIITPGNHDMEGARLSDRDSLGVIGTSGLVRVPRDSGPVDTFIINSPGGGSFRVGVGVTPYGQPIPENVEGAFREVGGVVWLTHHDLAFGGPYPGALPLHEIRGCALVFNGHMHDAQPASTIGETTWCNMGSVARTSMAAMNHEPRAWRFDPEGGLIPVTLPHRKDVFNLTGRLIQAAAADAEEGAAEMVEAEQDRDSAFVGLLVSDGMATTRTDSAVFIKEELDTRFADGRISAAVRTYLDDLRKLAIAA